MIDVDFAPSSGVGISPASGRLRGRPGDDRYPRRRRHCRSDLKLLDRRLHDVAIARSRSLVVLTECNLRSGVDASWDGLNEVSVIKVPYPRFLASRRRRGTTTGSPLAAEMPRLVRSEREDI